MGESSSCPHESYDQSGMRWVDVNDDYGYWEFYNQYGKIYRRQLQYKEAGDWEYISHDSNIEYVKRFVKDE